MFIKKTYENTIFPPLYLFYAFFERLQKGGGGGWMSIPGGPYMYGAVQ